MVYFILIVFIIVLAVVGRENEKNDREKLEQERLEKLGKERQKRLEKERIEKEKLEQERLEQEKLEKEENKKNTLIESFYKNNKDILDNLCEEYYTSTQNLIKLLGSDSFYDYFGISDYLSEDTYKIFAKDLFSTAFIERDGYKESFFDYYNNPEDANKIVIYSESLKNKIKSKWGCNETLNLAVYFIIRQNFIKYRSENYLLNYGFEDLTELCDYSLNHKESVMMEDFISQFTYYWINKTNIELPIVDTYDSLMETAKITFKQLETNYLEKKLFNKNKNLVLTTNNLNIEPTKNVNETSIENIDKMNGREFEEFITNLFIKRGYKTTLTQISGDYGIDVIVIDDFIRIGIQTKCYTQKVGNSAIQEAIAGLKHYNLDKAMVITNNFYTPAAIQLARENNVIIWDRNKLIAEIRQ